MLTTIATAFGTFRALPRWVHYGIAAALAVAAFLVWDHFDDKQAIKDDRAQREAAAQGARDVAASERATDAAIDTANEKDLHNAIDAAPTGGSLSPAAHALACERLRKLGRIPPACGSVRAP